MPGGGDHGSAHRPGVPGPLSPLARPPGAAAAARLPAGPGPSPRTGLRLPGGRARALPGCCPGPGRGFSPATEALARAPCAFPLELAPGVQPPDGPSGWLAESGCGHGRGLPHRLRWLLFLRGGDRRRQLARRLALPRQAACRAHPPYLHLRRGRSPRLPHQPGGGATVRGAGAGLPRTAHRRVRSQAARGCHRALSQGPGARLRAP